MQDEIGEVTPHGRAVFETVTTAATGQPHIVPGRVSIDQQVAIVRVFVLANPGFGQRASRQRRKTPCEIGSNIGERLVRDPAVGRVRVDAGSMGGEPSARPWLAVTPRPLCRRS